MQIQAQRSETVEFLASLSSPATRGVYSKALILIFAESEFENADNFLSVVRSEKAKAESFLLTWLASHKNTLSGCTSRTYFVALKSFCEFSEAEINWKKMLKGSPRYSLSTDRPVSIMEIRRLFDGAVVKLKFLSASWHRQK